MHKKILFLILVSFTVFFLLSSPSTAQFIGINFGQPNFGATGASWFPGIQTTAFSMIPGVNNSFLGNIRGNWGGSLFNLGFMNSFGPLPQYSYTLQGTQPNLGPGGFFNPFSQYGALSFLNPPNPFSPIWWGSNNSSSNFIMNSGFVQSSSINNWGLKGPNFSNGLGVFNMWAGVSPWLGYPSPGSGSGVPQQSIPTGLLSLSLTDASVKGYKAVYVTIKEVRVHAGDDNNIGEEYGWESVAFPNKTYNLLELVNGVMEKLGTKELETGVYSQMRLIIGETPDAEKNLFGESHPFANYIVDSINNIYQLKIPSGFKTGLKLVHKFEILKGITTELILDFDVAKSVVRAGKTGKYILKPTIKVIGSIENAVLKGTVTDTDSNALEGASVNAQIYNSQAEDEKDKIIVQASTFTDEAGGFKLILEPGTYNITGYKDGYMPECTQIIAQHNTQYIHEFILNPTTTGTIAGGITGQFDLLENEAQFVTVSFRQMINCSGQEVEIELVSFTAGVENDTYQYSVSVPPGDYSVVASTEGEDTLLFTDINVEEDEEVLLDIEFPQ